MANKKLFEQTITKVSAVNCILLNFPLCCQDYAMSRANLDQTLYKFKLRLHNLQNQLSCAQMFQISCFMLTTESVRYY